jgi:hypothetical protein
LYKPELLATWLVCSRGFRLIRPHPPACLHVKHSLQQPASPLSPLSRSLLLLAPKHVLAQCLALGCVLTILFAYVPLLFAHKYKWDGEKSVAPKWSLEPIRKPRIHRFSSRE